MNWSRCRKSNDIQYVYRDKFGDNLNNCIFSWIFGDIPVLLKSSRPLLMYPKITETWPKVSQLLVPKSPKTAHDWFHCQLSLKIYLWGIHNFVILSLDHSQFIWFGNASDYMCLSYCHFRIKRNVYNWIVEFLTFRDKAPRYLKCLLYRLDLIRLDVL